MYSELFECEIEQALNYTVLCFILVALVLPSLFFQVLHLKYHGSHSKTGLSSCQLQEENCPMFTICLYSVHVYHCIAVFLAIEVWVHQREQVICFVRTEWEFFMVLFGAQHDPNGHGVNSQTCQWSSRTA